MNTVGLFAEVEATFDILPIAEKIRSVLVLRIRLITFQVLLRVARSDSH